MEKKKSQLLFRWIIACIILLVIGVSGYNIYNFMQKSNQVPKQITGTYLTSNKDDTSFPMPTIIHISNHRINFQMIPKNTSKAMRQKIDDYDERLYNSGSQQAMKSKNKYKRNAMFLRNMKIIQKTNNRFKNKHGANYQAMKRDIQELNMVHISTVRYMHHYYYIKGKMTSTLYAPTKNNKHIKAIPQHSNNYYMYKLRTNKQHKLVYNSSSAIIKRVLKIKRISNKHARKVLKKYHIYQNKHYSVFK